MLKDLITSMKDIIIFKDLNTISSWIRAFGRRSITGQGGKTRTSGLGMCGLYQSHTIINSTHNLPIAYYGDRQYTGHYFFLHNTSVEAGVFVPILQMRSWTQRGQVHVACSKQS